MLIIAIYWIFLSALFIPLGILTAKALRIETRNITFALILGLISGSVLFSITAFFAPLNGICLGITTLIAMASAYYYRGDYKEYLAAFNTDLKALPKYLKICLVFLLFGSLLKSAGAPFIVDNESYYIQTIKWLNEYGFVKGLANLHIFFAQTSAWHVLQAGVNFSFITNRINDINGFVFIWIIFYHFSESQKNPFAGWLKYYTLFSVLLFQFIDSPSPDFPLLIFLPTLIYLLSTQKDNPGERAIAFLLFAFLCTIKITILPLGLLFIKDLFQKKTWAVILKGAIPLVVLWVAKNVIISGYPLYPLHYFKMSTDWAVNTDAYNFIVKITSDYGYYKELYDPGNISLPQKLKYWISLPLLDGMLNKAAVAIFIITPVFMYLKKSTQYPAYFALLINFIAVLCTAPQFRYYLPQVLVLACYCIAMVVSYFKNNNISRPMLILGCVAAYIPFFSLSLSSLSRNSLHKSTGHVALSQLYLPEKNTRFKDMKYLHAEKGNLNFYYTEKDFLMYGTADGPLPCINPRQIEFYKSHFGIVPQLRGNTLKDGFYSQSVK
ncbi:LIC_10190 family membrane protein [Flavobacterium psychrotrophum]|uniref:LIC_10190 family membrane protein n=1 Tax=Flavobacterium psychrotrophum TaxID=2294119 RepID=UPI0013C44878|nr:hypothetical protein [Flavobacterium psychrotrophum]